MDTRIASNCTYVCASDTYHSLHTTAYTVHNRLCLPIHSRYVCTTIQLREQPAGVAAAADGHTPETHRLGLSHQSFTNNQLIGTKPNPVRWTRGPLTFPTLYGGTRLVPCGWRVRSQETEKNVYFRTLKCSVRTPRTWRQLRLHTLRTAYVCSSNKSGPLQIFYLLRNHLARVCSNLPSGL